MEMEMEAKIGECPYVKPSYPFDFGTVRLERRLDEGSSDVDPIVDDLLMTEAPSIVLHPTIATQSVSLFAKVSTQGDV